MGVKFSVIREPSVSKKYTGVEDGNHWWVFRGNLTVGPTTFALYQCANCDCYATGTPRKDTADYITPSCFNGGTDFKGRDLNK